MSNKNKETFVRDFTKLLALDLATANHGDFTDFVGVLADALSIEDGSTDLAIDCAPLAGMADNSITQLAISGFAYVLPGAGRSAAH